MTTTTTTRNISPTAERVGIESSGNAKHRRVEAQAAEEALPVGKCGLLLELLRRCPVGGVVHLMRRRKMTTPPPDRTAAVGRSEARILQILRHGFLD